MNKLKFRMNAPLWLVVTLGLTLGACTIQPVTKETNADAGGDSGGGGGSEAGRAGGESGGRGGTGTLAPSTSQSTGGTKSTSTTTVQTGQSCDIGGKIIESTTLAPSSACPKGYAVVSNIKVTGKNTTLTIEPGTVLNFDSNIELDVEDSASLKAVGTKEAPIVFTGWQQAPGAWGGIYVSSDAIGSQIAYATISYAGAEDFANGAISLGSGATSARLGISNVEMTHNAKFGLSLAALAILTQFHDNLFANNQLGAIRSRSESVHMLTGTNNRLENNGSNNSIRVVTGSTAPGDITWPNLSPSAYRIVNESGVGRGQIDVKGHLTIAAGATLEFSPGSGIIVEEGNAGIAVLGTTSEPVVLRGVDGGGWLGVGFYASSWSGNAFENVRFENALGAPENYVSCTQILGKPGDASVVVGHLQTTSPSHLRVYNVTFEGPNAADWDIVVRTPASTLVVEGTNHGRATDGGLQIWKMNG